MIEIEIKKNVLMSAAAKNNGLLRLELTLADARMVEIDAPEYHRFLPVIGENWSSTKSGRSHNTKPVEFPITESGWKEWINYVVAVIAGTSYAVGAGRLTPTVIGPRRRLTFAPGEIEIVLVD